jgi:uncharacterized protein (UPF0548 family)
MLFFRRPSRPALEAFVDKHRDAKLSYREVGCAAGETPASYVCDHERTELGRGIQTFQAACEAFRAWKMFDLGWVSVADPHCPLVVGQVVGVLARVGCVWMLNACRILEVVDEPDRRLGFTYGTLGDHVEQGEERFLIERDSADRVWFELRAVSRPHFWYVRILRPLARLFQLRFRRGAAAAMLRAAKPLAG